MSDGKTNKLCISLPDETIAQLVYLAKRYGCPPTVKRSQVIQQAIWQAYTAECGKESNGIPSVTSYSDYDFLCI